MAACYARLLPQHTNVVEKSKQAFQGEGLADKENSDAGDEALQQKGGAVHQDDQKEGRPAYHASDLALLVPWYMRAWQMTLE